VGLAGAPSDAVAPEELEARADAGLFAARAAGVRVSERPEPHDLPD
jgi:predicted signal transduction protein with EAL and GGDEF domain